MKRCCACTETKAVSEFNKNRTTRDGYNTWCRQCRANYEKENKKKIAKQRAAYRKANRPRCAKRDAEYRKSNKEKIAERQARWYQENRENVLVRSRASRLARSFGITIEQYDEMLDAQNNGCAICGKTQEQNTNGRRLAIDHNHETGEVRGLLCDKCNMAIGLMNDDPVLFSKVARYLT